MAYDSQRGRIVMFGGRASTSQLLPETWEFDGTQWTLRFIPTPIARHLHAMAYDVGRGKMVMSGGRDAIGNRLRETWLYDGSWQMVSGAGDPGFTLHTMAFDPARGRVAQFGGGDAQSPLANDQLLEFDGTQWVQLAQLVKPPPPSDSVFRYDAVVTDTRRGRIVLMGPGVWEYEPAPVATWATYGPGCAVGSNPSLALAGATTAGPALGSSFAVTLTTTPPQSSLALLAFGAGLDRWNGTPLPVDLAALGGPGCLLWVPADHSVLALLPTGTTTLSLPVPADPQLAGATFGLQAVLVDGNAASLFGGISNAIAVRIQ